MQNESPFGKATQLVTKGIVDVKRDYFLTVIDIKAVKLVIDVSEVKLLNTRFSWYWYLSNTNLRIKECKSYGK